MKTYHRQQISEQSTQRIADITTKTIVTVDTIAVPVTTITATALPILDLSTLEVSAKVTCRNASFVPRSV